MTQLKKYWMLDWVPYGIDETDMVYIDGLGCRTTVTKAETQQVPVSINRMETVVTKMPEIIIETTSDKQEVMLKLKYSDRLFLIQVYNESKSPFGQ